MQQSDRAGLLYALAGFCTLSIGDAIIKGMAGAWPAPAMAATRYVAGTLLLTVLLLRYEGAAALRLPRDALQWLRGVAISISAVGMFLAVWLMPLAEATTIVFTQPVITAVLAMIFLGERARLSTWLATLVAFSGVFLVLRPNFETAGWGVLLPVLSATGMAVTIIASTAVMIGWVKTIVVASASGISHTARNMPTAEMLIATPRSHCSASRGRRSAALPSSRTSRTVSSRAPAT